MRSSRCESSFWLGRKSSRTYQDVVSMIKEDVTVSLSGCGHHGAADVAAEYCGDELAVGGGRAERSWFLFSMGGGGAGKRVEAVREAVREVGDELELCQSLEGSGLGMFDDLVVVIVLEVLLCGW